MPAERPLRILYVDDELVNLKLVKAVIAFVLKRPDEVVAVSSGAEGLERLAAGVPFDVVLSDQRMPGMSGTQFLALVKQKYPAAARVIVTGYNDDPDVRMAQRSGLAQAIIPKPWQSQEMYETLCAAVARHRKG
jgi:CheY-like chemotaxis protein